MLFHLFDIGNPDPYQARDLAFWALSLVPDGLYGAVAGLAVCLFVFKVLLEDRIKIEGTYAFATYVAFAFVGVCVVCSANPVNQSLVSGHP